MNESDNTADTGGLVARLLDELACEDAVAKRLEDNARRRAFVEKLCSKIWPENAFEISSTTP